MAEEWIGAFRQRGRALISSLARQSKHFYWSKRLARLGEGTFLSRGVRVQGGERVVVGRDCFVGHGVMFFGNTSPPKMLTIGDRVIIREFAYLSATNGEIAIGDGTFVGPMTTIYGNGGVFVGQNVLLAAQCCIASINHRFEERHLPIARQGLDCRPVVIEDDVWVGANVTIVPGVTIGRGAVIGAGAVVSKDIPPDTVAVGAPLRLRPRHELREPSFSSVSQQPEEKQKEQAPSPGEEEERQSLLAEVEEKMGRASLRHLSEIDFRES